MDNFETYQMVSPRDVKLQSTQMHGNLVKFFSWEKGKIVNVMLEILDGFWYEFWFTGIENPRFRKWLSILNWSK